MTEVEYTDIIAASRRIAPFARLTPLLSSPRLDAIIGGRLLMKAEPLQVTGSFKFRGACNAVQMLDDETKTIVAWSSGNHAQAIAHAANTRGIRAIIVMPEDAPETKKQGAKELGGEIITYDRYRESREDIGTALAEEHQAAIIPPFDDPRVIAGQGTIGVEIANQIEALNLRLDQVICCAGGGGLLAGLCLGLHEHMPQTSIYCAEPEHFDDFSQSLLSGVRECNDPNARSICDAILTPSPGALTFPIAKAHVTAGLVVSDDNVLDAMALAWQHLKLVVEPAGAVALASALSGKIDLRDKTTVVVASGGNVDKAIFNKALARLQLQP
jgi:threonine dehydratase